jgi:DME family drug/metabolite transporter
MIGELAALAAAIGWAFSSVAYRKALSNASPFQANAIRSISAGALLFVIGAVFGKTGNLVDLPLSVALAAGLSGIISLVLADTLYMFSLKHLGVSRAVPIASTYPLFNILIAVTLKGEEITPFIIIGAVSIISGIWLISRQENNAVTNSHTKTMTKGLIASLSAAVMWAAGMTLMNDAVTNVETSTLDDAFAINLIRVLAASILLLATSPFADRQFKLLKAPKKIWLILAVSGLVSLGLAWFLLAFSFLHIKGSVAVPISSTTPLFSTIAGIVFLKEPITKQITLGSIIIVLGTFLLFA